MEQVTELRDGGRLRLWSSFLNHETANSLLTWCLAHVPWRQERAIFGRMAPRLNAFVAAEGVNYRYSGLTFTGRGWRNELLIVRDRVAWACGATFNSVLLNRYRDGRDSMGMHADDEKELGDNPAVATLSLGSERTLTFRHTASGESLRIPLPHGSLLLMDGTTQQHWQHGINKTRRIVGDRISLTFRTVTHK